MKSVIPVTIIGGYLGSGKTTLVNHLLRNTQGVKLAVLVNDFGELPIDADLIEAEDGDVISLSGGCICCSYGDDLSLCLQTLQTQESPPDHIVIESSGVALPGAVGRSMSLLRAYQLKGIVVVADATRIQLAADDRYIGDTIQRQLSDADLIILNKQDMLSEVQLQSVRQWMSQRFAQARFIDSVYSRVDPDVLLGMQQEELTKFEDYKDSHTHDITSLFSSVKLTIFHGVDASTLAAQLADERCGLVRAKGFVRNLDNTIKTIQVVGRQWSVTDAPAGVQTGVICIAESANLSEKTIRSFCNLG